MKTTNFLKVILLVAAGLMSFLIQAPPAESKDVNPPGVVYHPDSVFVYNFEGNSKETYSYDLSQNLVSRLKQIELSRSWENSEMNTYTYDENGHLLTDTFQQWNGSEWVNATLFTNTYDGDGNMLTSLGQLWDGAAWANSTLFTYTYDENGNRLSFMNQYWDTDAWYNSELSTYTYDENGNQLTDTWHMWEGTDWVAYMLTTFTCDENGNRLTLLEQYWEGEWLNYNFVAYTYDENNNETYHLAQTWLGEGWENMSQATFTYDINGNCLGRIDQWWISIWNNTYKTEYEYQPGLITGHGYIWNGTDWEVGDTYSMLVCLYNDGHQELLWDYGPCHLIEVYYSGYGVGIPEKYAEQPLSFSISPNPAHESLTITTESSQAGRVFITLSDLSGRETATLYEGIIQPGTQQVTVSTNNLPAGLYILEMRSGMGSSRQKICIIR